MILGETTIMVGIGRYQIFPTIIKPFSEHCSGTITYGFAALFFEPLVALLVLKNIQQMTNNETFNLLFCISGGPEVSNIQKVDLEKLHP